ncbi:MAG: threonine-phosphate decarboxylase CobD [Nitrospirota bacterium]
MNYFHGGNIYSASRKYRIKEERIIDFSASINPLGVSRKAKATIRKAIKRLPNYPDPDVEALRRLISIRYNISPESILCGNGSTELIYLIPMAFKPHGVLIPQPTFSEYERACQISSELRVMSYELKEEDGFKINPDEFISLITHHSSLSFNMAFLCNPNNPTGHLLKKDEVMRLCSAAFERNIMVVVDEAFIDFTPEESIIREASESRHVICLRSFTKFYALAGLRIGYAVTHADTAKHLKAFKEPWTVNTLAQKASIVSMKDKTYIKNTFEVIASEKEFLLKAIKKIDGLSPLPSSANFLLIRIEDERFNSTNLSEILARRGMLVRDCASFGIGNRYIRIAVKSHAHNAKLVKTLKGIFGETGFKDS